MNHKTLTVSFDLAHFLFFEYYGSVTRDESA